MTITCQRYNSLDYGQLMSLVAGNIKLGGHGGSLKEGQPDIYEQWSSRLFCIVNSACMVDLELI
jgi:hypothetical protein